MTRMDTTQKRIPSAGPSITEAEIQAVTQAMRNGWYENMNVHLDSFVSAFREHTGRKHVLPTVNGTAALHLALLSLDIGPGDEVIVPEITWVSSACVVSYCGATPVFVDIDKNNWCMDPSSMEDAITPKTKAIIIVDLYGNMPDMDAICEIAKKHRIPLIEDAAEAAGATYKGKPAGSFGDISIFSFNATKIIMAGQGGCLVTDNDELYNTASILRHHGMIKTPGSKSFWSSFIGYNYNWTNFQAALALAQLKRLPELVEQKREYAKEYSKLLKHPDIQLPVEEEGVHNTYWVYTLVLHGKFQRKKEEVMKALSDKGIDTRPFFYPISMQPAYQQYVSGEDMAKKNPVAYSLSLYGISLPSSFSLTPDQITYVCEELFHTLQ